MQMGRFGCLGESFELDRFGCLGLPTAAAPACCGVPPAVHTPVTSKLSAAPPNCAPSAGSLV